MRWDGMEATGLKCESSLLSPMRRSSEARRGNEELDAHLDRTESQTTSILHTI